MATADPTWTQTIIILAALVVPLVYAFTHHGRARKLTLMILVPWWLFVARIVYLNPAPAAPLEWQLRRAVIEQLMDPMNIVWPLFVLFVYGLIRRFTRSAPTPATVRPGTSAVPMVVAPVDYPAYLRSAEWRQRREEAIRRAGGRCQLCNDAGPLEVHHRTYDRLGHELPGDLTVLCRACHGRLHELIGMPVRS